MNHMEHENNIHPSIEKFLSIAEVRERLGISHSFAYSLIRSGDLPASKLGGRTIIKASDLIKLTQNLRRA